MSTPDAAADPLDPSKMALSASAASVGTMLRSGRRLLRLLDVATPGTLSWLAIGATVEAASMTALPYATKQIIDAVVRANGAVRVPMTWLIIEAAIMTTFVVASSLTRYQTRVFEVRAAPYLLERVLEKSSRVPFPNLESTDFLDKLSRARQDAEHYGINYASQMIKVGSSLLVFAGSLAVLTWLAPLWTLAVVVVAAVLPFTFELQRAREAFALERKNLQHHRQAWHLEWLLLASDPAKELRATGIGTWLVDLHARIHAPFLDGHVEIAGRLFRRNWLSAGVTTAALYGPYLYFLFATVSGERTLGELLMFVLVFRQATNALTQLLGAIAGAFEHHLYIDNLFQVLDHPEDMEGRGCAPKDEHVVEEAPEFAIDNLWFTYPGGAQPVLRGLDLRVRAGETLALVGRNGIGKSTLVKVLLGLYPLDRGTIKIGDLDVKTQTMGWRRDNIGVVFQDFVRYQFSARLNVGLGWCSAADDNAAVSRAVEMAGAKSMLDELPSGIETPLGAAFGGQDLSGGQWQRIALARLFMRRSRIWILDEPTSAMDPETEERTVRDFRKWTTGRTSIVITHRFSTARIADRIAVVDEGRVTELGTHAELMAAGKEYARMFNLQAQAFEEAG